MHIVLIFGRQTPLFQFSIDLWKSTTLNNFHDRLTLLPLLSVKSLHYINFKTDCHWPSLLQSRIDLWKTITLNKFNIEQIAHCGHI